MTPSSRSLWLAGAGVLPVALAPRPATVALWAAIWFIVVLLDALAAPKPSVLRVSRETTPSSVRLGESAHSQLIVYNSSSRRVRALIKDIWPPTARRSSTPSEVLIPPAERRRLTGVLSPIRRGRRHAIGVAIRTAGPLGLSYRHATLDVPGELLVLPPFASRHHLPSRLARLREMDGNSSVNVRGQGTEFDSLREYVIGDDVRAIDWRATARSRDLMVRTWRPERDRRVVLVLDTGRLSAVRIGFGTRLDASIEAALLLASLAAHAGDRIDVIAADTDVHAHVSATTATTLMHELAVTLSDLDPHLEETDWQRISAHVRQTVSQRALIVFVTALDSAVISGSMRRAVATLAARHTVVVAGAYDGEIDALAATRDDVDDVYTAAAAEGALLENREAILGLTRAGASVVSSSAESLPPDLADRYLQLKATGQL
ncbi:MAG: DUF58 domain-containing protein [Bowdeniella nasicola]|nr:DUF58 domain-containing protein [Bowdeniella nasicola]